MRRIRPDPLACHLCGTALEPIVDRDAWRFARCPDCGRVYLAGEGEASAGSTVRKVRAQQAHSHSSAA